MTAADFFCEHHASIRAAALCGLCLKPLCGDCAIETNGVFFCDDSHAALFAAHTKVISASSPFEADAVTANLRPLGVETLVYFLRDHTGVALTQSVDAVQVFVPNARAHEAREALRSLNLLPEQS